MSYHLLSEPIRKYIRDKRWDSLRPIQAAAISKILTTENNYVLASRTASGKTEAAFLPILTKTDFNKPGVRVLYISPLIALINDQFFRIEELCKNLEISVTKWHGEAKKSLKNKLLKTPNGIVLITPESLEAMFVNAPYNISKLFGDLDYIVIDEIHSFLGVDRGLQLMSLLARLKQVNRSKIITIGLSATIGRENYIESKRLIGDIENTKILLDDTKKETAATFKYFQSTGPELALDLLKDLYKATSSSKALIFPNSRGRTEEIAVKLRKISDIVKGHKHYYSHHSSVDKEIREYIEHFAKNNERFNFCISCTSTLELGIDIGTVDKIVQIDSTHSVASLVQRIGRSGRREGEKSIVDLYATDQWSLLQALACWNLYKADILEPIQTAQKPFDILLHQLLSIVKQLSGCTRSNLLHRVKTNSTFNAITEEEILDLIEQSVKADFLEQIQSELILGIEGERIVNSRDFYSVFQTEQNLKVIFKGNKIGDIPFSPQVKPDENILLAAKIWKIIDVDIKSGKITVKPAKDGKKPKFFGNGGNVHTIVRREMLRILKSHEEFPELTNTSKNELANLKSDFKGSEITDIKYDCPIIIKGNKLIIYTFTGTRINKSLNYLLGIIEKEVIHVEGTSSFEIKLNNTEFNSFREQLKEACKNVDTYLAAELKNSELLISFSKWGKYLPVKYQVEILKERFFDFENTLDFIDNMNWVEIQ